MTEQDVLNQIIVHWKAYSKDRITKFLVEKGLELYKIHKMGAPKIECLTEKDLVDAGFGC